MPDVVKQHFNELWNKLLTDISIRKAANANSVELDQLREEFYRECKFMFTGEEI